MYTNRKHERLCWSHSNKRIKSPGGSDKWSKNTIIGLLTNEKYKGDVLLQKTYKKDHLDKRMRVNHGEIRQNYVRENHHAIVPPDVWEVAQAELARREKLGGKMQSNSVFSGKIVCGECGGFFGRKVWNSNSKYRRNVWQCNEKYRDSSCKAPHLTEHQIEGTFVRAWNEVFEFKDELVAELRGYIADSARNAELHTEIAKLQTESEQVAKTAEKLIKSAMTSDMSSEALGVELEKLEQNQNAIMSKIDDYEKEIQAETLHKSHCEQLAEYLENATAELEMFNESLWQMAVDKFIVGESDVKVIFRNGTSVAVEQNGR